MNQVQMLVRTFLRPNIARFAPIVDRTRVSESLLSNVAQKWFCSSVLRPMLAPRQLLTLPPTTVVPTAGFKVKHALRRRCKDCFFVFRNERMLVLCRTHQRHKQMTPERKPKYTWQISHATQSKIRPW